MLNRPRPDSGENTGWPAVAQEEVEPIPASDTYQTASGGHVLDGTLDRMMSGAPMSRSEEQAVLERWGDKGS